MGTRALTLFRITRGSDVGPGESALSLREPSFHQHLEDSSALPRGALLPLGPPPLSTPPPPPVLLHPPLSTPPRVLLHPLLSMPPPVLLLSRCS